MEECSHNCTRVYSQNSHGCTYAGDGVSSDKEQVRQQKDGKSLKLEGVSTNTKLPRSHTKSKGSIATDTELYRLYTGRVDGYNWLSFLMLCWETLRLYFQPRKENTKRRKVAHNIKDEEWVKGETGTVAEARAGLGTGRTTTILSSFTI